MKKHTLSGYVLAPMLGLGLLGGAGVALAHGFEGLGLGSKATPEEIATRQQELFQKEASLLGVSLDEVKAAWASGKSLETLATEKGISKETLRAKMEAERKASVTAELQMLVSKGVITQAQADARLKFLESLPKGRRGGGMGMHKGMYKRGFGF